MTDDKQTLPTSLDSISVEGFRSIARLERLRLRPINVLIGANGSGKSNLIQAFDLLGASHLDRLDEFAARTGGADRNLHFGAKATTRLRLGIAFKDGKTYEVELRPTPDDRLSLHQHIVGPLPPHLASSVGDMDEPTRIFEAMKQERLDRLRVYHFDDVGSVGSPMLRTAQLHDNRFLRESGENIAAFLYYLKKKVPTAYRDIQQTLRLAAPFFDDFILEPQALNENMIRLAWRHRTSDAHFDISVFSDGTRRFLALATLLLQPARLRPSVILLDEPELGLHPYAMGLLCELVKSVAVETQIVLATQSPFLVDHFEPEDVIVVDRVDGQSEFRRLSTQALKAWLSDYSLGDLWLMNELGGRPSYEKPSLRDR